MKLLFENKLPLVQIFRITFSCSFGKLFLLKLLEESKGNYTVCFKFLVNKYLQIDSLQKIPQDDIKGKRKLNIFQARRICHYKLYKVC